MKWIWLAACVLALASSLCATDDFEFVVIGDTRPKFESVSFEAFSRLISDINALKPALVVNLGDLIYGYGPLSKERQWDKYEAVLKELRVPYYQAPGNHDTHSKDARKIYGRRFGKFYQSFDHGDCHFVLLDNNEDERHGYLGPQQLAWLKADLAGNYSRSVYVFMHFPAWESDRIKPVHHEFWQKTLHPLFKQSRVRAVFGGHYHTYGPTREFDGIRYFITGGGGAELNPEYRRAGGGHHFMRVKVAGDSFDVRVVTEHGELNDPEADVMGGLQFAARNVSRIGVRPGATSLKDGVPVSVAVRNPAADPLTGEARWLMDASAFSVQPESVKLDIPSGRTSTYNFTLKARHDSTALTSLPQLEFNTSSGAVRRRFHREVRFLYEAQSGYRSRALTLDGGLEDWEGTRALTIGRDEKPEAVLRSCHDEQYLYLAVTVPQVDGEEAQEIGVSDELQLGFARELGESEFGADQLRLGFNADTSVANDRTPGRKAESTLAGARSGSRSEGPWKTFEIQLPLKRLKSLKPGERDRLVVDLSFPVPEPDAGEGGGVEPRVNTFAYSVRYGSDALVPVYFVELILERRR